MNPSLHQQLDRYAHLLIHTGVNLQPGQALRIRGELVHREFIHRLAAQAYDAGARFVDVQWQDPVLVKARVERSQPEHLSFMPDYLEAWGKEVVENDWAVITITGSEFPDIFDQVDPQRMRAVFAAYMQKLAAYRQGLMAGKAAWNVCGAATPAWAQKVFPQLGPEEALEQLWQAIFHAVRLDQDDPVQAWEEHDRKLKQLVRYLTENQVHSIHFLDPTPGPDGKPSTDLVVGLTDEPAWVGGSTQTQSGRRFFPNMPTEEVFSTPHRQRAQGWTRISRPAFPFQREVRDAFFRFQDGELVEFRSEDGQEVLEQFFQIPGTRHLGEVALVDSTSPIFQSQLVFYDILFDENAACHIAFGRGYPMGIHKGQERTPEELAAMGLNESDAHLDMMIGTTTMNITGLCPDGREAPIMEQGVFVSAIFQGQEGPE